MAASSAFQTIFLVILLFSFSASQISAQPTTKTQSGCDPGPTHQCHNKPAALRLKLIAIFSILITSMMGVCVPLLTRSIPSLGPDRDLFVIVKAFASGVILATGYMHVMPDSFNDLNSPCLPETPWRKFPFTTFVAMLSALVTLMVDSLSMSFYRRCSTATQIAKDSLGQMTQNGDSEKGLHCRHGFSVNTKDEEEGSTLMRHRVVAQVLEVGIVVHSVVIGLSLGTSGNPCTIRPLVAALCFHQLFEGMGLGGCILQAEYATKMKSIMVFFFSAMTPFGVALGIGLSNIYSENSPTALIVVGLLNASSAGLLNYMALVDLLAYDFMGSKLQRSLKLHLWAYIAVLLGAGGMSLMAKWA